MAAATPAAARRVGRDEQGKAKRKRHAAGEASGGGRWPSIKPKPDLQVSRLKGDSLFTSFRYKAGQRFGRHIDESVDLGEGLTTQYTLLIYLSGHLGPKVKNDSRGNPDSSMLSLVGGETVFYDERRGTVAEVAPAEGMALLHIHGDRCMLHEARAVVKGIKYVLRSDVAFA